MTAPLLTTKLYIPPPRSNLVPRPRLIQRLDEGLWLGRTLTLVSAQGNCLPLPASTLVVSEFDVNH